MKKQIILSMVVATIAIGAVGCGGNSSNNDENLSKPDTGNFNPEDNNSGDNNSVVEREINSEFTMPTSGLETRDYGYDITISKDTQNDDVYITFKHDDEGKRVQFYIDTDNDNSTGNSVYDGAELLVSGLQEEDGSAWKLKKQFWKSDDTNQTNWIEDVNGSNNDIFYNSGETEDSIKLTNGLIANNYFSATAEVDDNWTALSITEKMAFDIDLADSGNPETVNGDSNLSIVIDHNATNISMKLIGEHYTAYTTIFIDSDEDNNTGHNPSIWANLGADYMIKDGKLYSRVADDTGWDYDNIEKVSYVIKDSINFDFKKSDFNNTDTMIIGVGIYGADNDWETTHSIPERNTSTVITPYNLN